MPELSDAIMKLYEEQCESARKVLLDTRYNYETYLLDNSPFKVGDKVSYKSPSPISYGSVDAIVIQVDTVGSGESNRRELAYTIVIPSSISTSSNASSVYDRHVTATVRIVPLNTLTEGWHKKDD